MDIRTKEAVRYLGYGTCAIDEQVMRLIQNSFLELEQVAVPKCIYRIFELSVPDENKIQIGNTIIESKNLSKNLFGCEQAILLGATLGAEVDRGFRKLEVLDITKALVMQACATAYLEEYLDGVKDKLSVELEKQNCYIRPRFSPGYGDFSILHQKDILGMLEATKHIGVSLTDGYMLTPTKSVTAIIGISKTKEPCHRRGCEECTKSDCAYRRSE